MIFVDTGAWYARLVADDVDHAQAIAWFRSPPDRVATSDYVVDELLTLLKARGDARARAHSARPTGTKPGRTTRVGRCGVLS